MMIYKIHQVQNQVVHKGDLLEITINMYICVFLISVWLAIFSTSANAIVVIDPIDRDNEAHVQTNFNILEKTYHDKAKEFPEVCAVLIKDPDDGMVDIGTGTYFAESGNSGFVVTAAHIATKAINKLPFLFLAFTPDYQSNHDRIAAKRVYIHPNFDPTMTDSDNDIAIIEFDISKLRSGISLRPIDFTKDYYSLKCLDGIILGYGHFGTTTTKLVDLGKVHYAKTFMYLYEEDETKSPVFKVTLPHLSNFYPKNDLISKEPYRFASEFAPIDSYGESQVILMHNLCRFRVHSNQGFCSGGDGGGPLLMKNKNGSYRFIGVAHSIGIEKHGGEAHSAIKTAFMTWEPLFNHRQWIKEIIKEESTEAVTSRDEL